MCIRVHLLDTTKMLSYHYRERSHRLRSMLDDFTTPNALGELPPGMHTATLEEVEAVFVTTPRRRRLFEGLRRAIQNLHAAGVRRVFINGSFVTTKADPNDIDGCWEWTEEVHLDLLDSVLLDFAQARQAMRDKYGVDFFLATWVEAARAHLPRLLPTATVRMTRKASCSLTWRRCRDRE